MTLAAVVLEQPNESHIVKVTLKSPVLPKVKQGFVAAEVSDVLKESPKSHFLLVIFVHVVVDESKKQTRNGPHPTLISEPIFAVKTRILR